MSIAETRALMAKMREEEEAKKREGDLGGKFMRGITAGVPAGIAGFVTGGPMGATAAALKAGSEAYNKPTADPLGIGLNEVSNVAGTKINKMFLDQEIADKLSRSPNLEPSELSAKGELTYKRETKERQPRPTPAKNATIGGLGQVGSLLYNSVMSELVSAEGNPEKKQEILSKLKETKKLPSKELAIISKEVINYNPKKGQINIDFSKVN